MIRLKSLFLIMKFVNHYANMDDVTTLYNIVKDAGLKIPLKEIDQFKKTVFLGQPLVISDYLKNVDQYEPMLKEHQDDQWEFNPDYDSDGGFANVKRQSTQFRPTLTDVGLCSTFNAEMENNVFQDETVGGFMEVFNKAGLDAKTITLATADLKEQSFIIDTQVRRNYPFVARGGSKKLARYATHVFFIFMMLLCRLISCYLLISRVAVNHPNEFFNVDDNSVEVEPGTEVLIRVQPTELVTDEGVTQVPIEKRGCRLASEVPEEMISLFKTYTRNACNFNCMYEYRY